MKELASLLIFLAWCCVLRLGYHRWHPTPATSAQQATWGFRVCRDCGLWERDPARELEPEFWRDAG